MKIGELARRSGLSPSRIRFYEAKGLLNAVTRQANGYRDYPPESLLILGIIAQAQQAGFSLEEIRGLMPTDLTAWEHDRLVDGIERKIATLRAMEERLAHTRGQLQVLVRHIGEKPQDMDCAANAGRILEDLFGSR